MPDKTRRQFTAAEKITILRKHLIEKVAISEICQQYRLQPKLFYNWQRLCCINQKRKRSAQPLEKVSFTVAQGLILGVGIAQSAGAEDLVQAYKEFQTEVI